MPPGPQVMATRASEGSSRWLMAARSARRVPFLGVDAGVLR